MYMEETDQSAGHDSSFGQFLECTRAWKVNRSDFGKELKKKLDLFMKFYELIKK